MDHQRMVERLQALPPELTAPADRLGQVENRVKRRRRHRGAAVVVAVVMAVGVGVPFAVSMDGSDRTVQRDPVTDRPDKTGPSEVPSPQPGGTEITRLGAAVDVTRTGTATIDLRRRPTGANAIEMDLRCLSAGTFSYSNGASVSCDDADADMLDDRPTSGYTIDLAPRQTGITISTTADASWRLTARYVSTRVTEWAVNDAGQTYGVDNFKGSPDLVLVIADNGASGYVSSDLLDDPTGGGGPQTPEEALEYMKATKGKTFRLPVYESDGRTRVGTFTTGGGSK